MGQARVRDNRQDTLTSVQVGSAGPIDAIETYLERGWADGLPITPPTPELVREFVAASGFPPGEIIGRLPSRGIAVTIEKVAVNAVMAGCLPEYMPVVIASVKAICNESFNLHANSATVSGAAPMMVVNGPIRRRLKINCAEGVFGPGWRANATIGRTIRLVIRNVCRSVPGALDRAAFSDPGRYTWCFGEDEEYSPWVPMHTQRGLRPESDAVTAFCVMNPVRVLDFSDTPEPFLNRAASMIRMAWLYQSLGTAERSLLAVIGRVHLGVLIRQNWVKSDIQAFLFEKLREPPKGFEVPSPIDNPKNVLVVVAGGDALPQSWFMVPFPHHEAVTCPI